MASVKIKIPVYVDAFFHTDGVHIFVEADGEYTEDIFPFMAMMDEFIEQYFIPSKPPKMHDEDRVNVKEMIDNLLNAIDYLRKLENDTETWGKKDHMGYRD